MIINLDTIKPCVYYNVEFDRENKSLFLRVDGVTDRLPSRVLVLVGDTPLGSYARTLQFAEQHLFSGNNCFGKCHLFHFGPICRTFWLRRGVLHVHRLDELRVHDLFTK